MRIVIGAIAGGAIGAVSLTVMSAAFGSSTFPSLFDLGGVLMAALVGAVIAAASGARRPPRR